MRGGEKCLEVLCRAFPDATLYTLIHRQGSLSPAIEAMAIRTSPLQRVPGVFRHYRHLLPLMPLAARPWRLGERRPRGQPEPLRRQGGPAAAGRAARLLLLHADALRLARPRRLPRRLVRPAGPAGAGRRRCSTGCATGTGRRPDRVTHFVAISETVRERIARCYGRDSRVIPPPVDTDFYTPARTRGRARTSTSASRRSSPTSGSTTR